MPTDKCRVCGNDFFEEALLRYANMPGVAQFLPDAGSVDKDRGIDLEVCQCSGCGLVQLSNDPVPYFKDVVRAAAFSEEMTQFRKEQFAGFVAGRGLGRKKIIEIGCGRGEYLSIMRQCDVEAFGLEHFDESVRHCAENGLNVQKGYIQSKYDALDNAPFDAFCMLNFLEHIPDPNTTMRGIYNNLSDDGVGLVEVPNFDMILRRNLFSEFMADHLCYFTKDTLAHTLRVNGFEIIECSEKWYDYMISVTVRKRTRTDLSCFESFKSALKTEVHEYMDRFEPNTVAIWGAGHQSLAVISLLELADRVKYVVDSAPFKQGKFTPATHIRIVSPETLRSKPVNAVIIMAASYSDEVAGIVRKEFDDKVNLAILRDYGLEII